MRKKMTDQEFIQKLPTIDDYFVIFCDFTKMPYVECDLETYDDKVFVFLDKKMADAFVADYKEDKMILSVHKIARAQIRDFFAILITDGINMISFRGEETHELQLNQIITRKLKEGAPQPLENPTLQISMMYFMQAVRTAETQEEQMITRQYEEEMMVNIARAHYLVPSRELEETDEEGNKKVALMQLKNGNGDLFIPLFTDLNEFFKSNREEGTTRFTIVGFDKIKQMNFQNCSGFIINPGSVAVLLNEQHIKAVDQRFGGEAGAQ
jgi:hypothetical protein